MDQDSDSDQQRQIAALEQTVFLTNGISKGPTLHEEANWMSEITSQWGRTLESLKIVFHWRGLQDATIDDIFRPCMVKLWNYARDPSDAHRYGTTIQESANKLKEYLQTNHKWHAPGSAECSCCKHPNLHGLQQAIVHQLDVLCKVDIPWTPILHGSHCI
jgi:hypothetical protein